MMISLKRMLPDSTRKLRSVYCCGNWEWKSTNGILVLYCRRFPRISRLARPLTHSKACLVPRNRSLADGIAVSRLPSSPPRTMSAMHVVSTSFVLSLISRSCLRMSSSP
uniref:(northern house mosquito) hypothetical protein n=1 Tax=Culex pipiens TaxID=7175 RepID=A0A8D8CLI6_CULPI